MRAFSLCPYVVTQFSELPSMHIRSAPPIWDANLGCPPCFLTPSCLPCQNVSLWEAETASVARNEHRAPRCTYSKHLRNTAKQVTEQVSSQLALINNMTASYSLTTAGLALLCFSSDVDAYYGNRWDLYLSPQRGRSVTTQLPGTWARRSRSIPLNREALARPHCQPGDRLDYVRALRPGCIAHLHSLLSHTTSTQQRTILLSFLSRKSTAKPSGSCSAIHSTLKSPNFFMNYSSHCPSCLRTPHPHPHTQIHRNLHWSIASLSPPMRLGRHRPWSQPSSTALSLDVFQQELAHVSSGQQVRSALRRASLPEWEKKKPLE